MRTNRLVNALLETDQADDMKFFLDNMPQATDTAGMLSELGFVKSRWSAYVYNLNVPINTTRFETNFDEGPPLHTDGFIVTVEPSHRPTATSGSNYSPDEWSAEHGYRMQVSAHMNNLCISISRNCISSRSHPLYIRLHTVITALLDAIKAVDAQGITDAYDFICAVDKAWGKQPNRLVIRKKKKV